MVRVLLRLIEIKVSVDSSVDSEQVHYRSDGEQRMKMVLTLDEGGVDVRDDEDDGRK